MHSVYRISGDALPAVVQSIYKHGLHIVTVEDFIKAKYGLTSSQLMSVNAGVSFSSSAIATAAKNSCSTNDFNINPPYPTAAGLGP